MNDKRKIVLKQCVIALLFVILAGVGLLLSNGVKINYNLADYLDETTETRAAIDIIEDEFGMTGNVQVMVRDVDVKTAKEIKRDISAVDGVLTVSFDEKDPNSYKDNTALFVILIDSDDYSQRANDTVAGIKEVLDARYGDVEYGGSVVKQTGLKNSTKKEMTLIIAIVICIVIALLTLTAKSWIEPIVLLASAGISIAINMGLNIFLGEISFITKSIVSILQLALSMDYSIILLHTYRDIKLEESDSNIAMKRTVKQVLAPVAASALTTVAGLFALLFMAFRIGFDIGVVLIKGIVVSAFTSLTLLPIFILLFEKLLEKTEKKPFVPKGDIFTRFALKANKIVAPIALVFVVLGGVLQSFNTYGFTDSKGENMSIIDEFGKKSSIVLVYPKGDNDFEREVLFYDKIKDYRDADGKLVLEKYNSYATSVREIYDLDKIESKLGLSRDYGEMLFAMYSLYQGNADVHMSFGEFIEYTNYLIENDPDVAGMLDENMSAMIKLIGNMDGIMEGEYTAEELAALVSVAPSSGTGVSEFAIRQMFGLYFYGTVSNKNVEFEKILSTMISASEDPDTEGMFDADMSASLKELHDGIATLRENLDSLGKPLDTEMTQDEFGVYMKEQFGAELPAGIVKLIFKETIGHDPLKADRVELADLLYTLATTQKFASELPEDKVDALKNIKNYQKADGEISKKYAYNDFIPALTSIVKNLTGETMEIDVDASAIQQIYIMYFNDIGAIENSSLSAREFIDFVKETAKTNETVANQVGANTINMLDDLETISAFFKNKDKFDYVGMSDRINELIAAAKSVSGEMSLDESKISGVYIKYMIENGVETVSSLMAYEFVDFICDNMDTNALLASKMTEDHKSLLKDAQTAIDGADELLIGDEYSRALLTVSLEAEGEETTKYIDYLLASVDEVFGEDAYIAGEVISTYDLQQAFTGDNIVISIFTIVSIFVVILLVFKSLSLPIILVAIIQGAVWIALSTQLVIGSSIFFMSYIVTTCVLMGATIDYGILMSSSYVQYRADHDKNEALALAVKATTPTVFTSGIILIVCGFVISLISTQNSISSVGDLLAKGTIVSVIMIMLALPSILYLLDKLVLALTVKSEVNARTLVQKIKNEKIRTFLEKIIGAFERFGEAVKKILGRISDFFDMLWDKIYPVLLPVAEATCRFAVSFAKKIKPFFIRVGAAIAKFARLVAEKTKALCKRIGPAFKSFGKAVCKFFKALGKKIKEISIKTAAAIKNAAFKTARAIKKATVKAAGAIKKATVKAAGAIKSLALKVAKAVKSGFTKLKAKASELIGKIKTKLNKK